jgi:hypothetical protein
MNVLLFLNVLLVVQSWYVGLVFASVIGGVAIQPWGIHLDFGNGQS